MRGDKKEEARGKQRQLTSSQHVVPTPDSKTRSVSSGCRDTLAGHGRHRRYRKSGDSSGLKSPWHRRPWTSIGARGSLQTRLKLRRLFCVLRCTTTAFCGCQAVGQLVDCQTTATAARAGLFHRSWFLCSGSCALADRRCQQDDCRWTLVLEQAKVKNACSGLLAPLVEVSRSHTSSPCEQEKE
jgi:hypothetical protein